MPQLLKLSYRFTMLETIEINPAKNANASIIWLHGLGASGHDFVDIVPQIHLPKNTTLRFIFPHAPFRKITFAHNTPMRAWFNITGLDTAQANQDEAGIYESQQLINELIDQEIARGIPGERIIIAGFSQGGAMALQCGLRYPEKIAGILVLSGFLLLADKLQQEKNLANQSTPIAMFHGELDHVVQIAWAKMSYEKLKDFGFNIAWRTYAMHHTLCPEEIIQINKWLQEVLTTTIDN